ncbi:MAG: hypothetical protein Q8O46_03230 [bacterium]|nr:hypothetical protein [bacterium]
MKTGKQIIILSLIAFFSHVIWENMQAPLFQGYASFVSHFSMCLVGTVGDVVITLFVYVLVALLKNDFNWIATLNKKDIVVLAVIGFFIAVGIEWRALLFGRWAYADAMPIIPYLEVGLTPILQMTLLLPLSMYLTKKIAPLSKTFGL